MQLFESWNKRIIYTIVIFRLDIFLLCNGHQKKLWEYNNIIIATKLEKYFLKNYFILSKMIFVEKLKSNLFD